MRHLLLLGMLLGHSVSVCPNISGPKPPGYRIVGYVFRPASIYGISAEKLTHINYAFALVSKDGEVVLNSPDAPAHLSQLQALKAKNPSLKIIVSVGGWGADNFSDAALTDASRDKFATERDRAHQTLRA